MKAIKTGLIKMVSIIAILGMVLVGLPGERLATAAGNPVPVQYYYVPFPEPQLLLGLQAIEFGGSGSAPTDPMTSYISIAAIAEGRLSTSTSGRTATTQTSPIQATCTAWQTLAGLKSGATATHPTARRQGSGAT